ncbi:MAG: single-stranded DNA-binding protein, partial [Bacteroidetes bacterium]
EMTQWHNITAWGKTADLIAKLLNKGQEVVVEGRLINNTYETKEGEKRYGTSIEVNEFLILAPRNESN